MPLDDEVAVVVIPGEACDNAAASVAPLTTARELASPETAATATAAANAAAATRAVRRATKLPARPSRALGAISGAVAGTGPAARPDPVSRRKRDC